MNDLERSVVEAARLAVASNCVDPDLGPPDRDLTAWNALVQAVSVLDANPKDLAQLVERLGLLTGSPTSAAVRALERNIRHYRWKTIGEVANAPTEDILDAHRVGAWTRQQWANALVSLGFTVAWRRIL